MEIINLLPKGLQGDTKYIALLERAVAESGVPLEQIWQCLRDWGRRELACRYEQALCLELERVKEEL